MNNNLDGKKVLVTGGTRGIGLAIATEMERAGALVTITGTKEKPEICKSRSFDYIKVDLENKDELLEFKSLLNDSNFDICINNAGINKIGEFEKLELNTFESIINVNLRAPFAICQGVLPWMKKNGWGRIVNISSIFGKISREFRAPYSASKFGLDGMTLALAAEVSKNGILVNCVCPGFIDTELTRNVLGEAGMMQLSEQIPIKRIGSPEEIARFVVFLSSPANTYITGQSLVIDGGFSRV